MGGLAGWAWAWLNGWDGWLGLAGWRGWLAGWAWLGAWAGLGGWSGLVGWAGYGSMGLVAWLVWVYGYIGSVSTCICICKYGWIYLTYIIFGVEPNKS